MAKKNFDDFIPQYPTESEAESIWQIISMATSSGEGVDEQSVTCGDYSDPIPEA